MQCLLIKAEEEMTTGSMKKYSLQYGKISVKIVYMPDCAVQFRSV